MSKRVVATFVFVVLAVAQSAGDVFGQAEGGKGAGDTTLLENFLGKSNSIPQPAAKPAECEPEVDVGGDDLQLNQTKENVADDVPRPGFETVESDASYVSPRDALNMSTTGRTPQTTDEEQIHWLRFERSARIPKSIQLESDRFAHRALLFEEPIHERHGIANCNSVAQATKSTAVFFGRAFALPASVLFRRHQICDSGEGWRESQGESSCFPK